MHVPFKIHYRNNLIDKKDSYLIPRPPSWDDRNYSYGHQLYPWILWSEEPSDRRRITNGCESFHCHFNEQFYTPHPSIFSFLDVITKHQCIMYIKLRNIDSVNLMTRTEKEKLDFLAQRTDMYRNGEISRMKYLKRLGFRFRARTDVDYFEITTLIRVPCLYERLWCLVIFIKSRSHVF